MALVKMEILSSVEHDYCRCGAEIPGSLDVADW
jgi:hypothetical protein